MGDDNNESRKQRSANRWRNNNSCRNLNVLIIILPSESNIYSWITAIIILADSITSGIVVISLGKIPPTLELIAKSVNIELETNDEECLSN